jgi:hypothetical protein
MWRFTGRGAAAEGEQYDSAHWWELRPGTAAEEVAGERDARTAGVHATGQVLQLTEVDAAYEEMRRVAVALGPASRIATRALGGLGAADAARIARATTKDEKGAPADGVPGWLRQQYRKALAKVWSDHMPIAVRLA